MNWGAERSEGVMGRNHPTTATWKIIFPSQKKRKQANKKYIFHGRKLFMQIGKYFFIVFMCLYNFASPYSVATLAGN